MLLTLAPIDSRALAATILDEKPIVKARVLTTNIDLGEGTCSLDRLESASQFFGLTLPGARAIIEEVATVTKTWRDTAKAVGARSAEIPAWRALSSMTISSARSSCDEKHLSAND